MFWGFFLFFVFFDFLDDGVSDLITHGFSDAGSEIEFRLMRGRGTEMHDHGGDGVGIAWQIGEGVYVEDGFREVVELSVIKRETAWEKS